MSKKTKPDENDYVLVDGVTPNGMKGKGVKIVTGERNPARARSQESASDGNIVVAAKNNDTVEIWWHNAQFNQNNLTIASRTDARSLYALLGVVLGGAVSATEP